MGEFPVDLRNWDPSEPAPSIAVEIRVRRREHVDQVTGYLGDHGIRCGSFEEWSLPCYVSGHFFGCVPVPLLAPLSELPGVEWIRVEFLFEPDCPTLLGGVSWGAIKDRFK